MRQAELAAVAIANRAAIIPLIPNVLAELPAQLEAAAHRDACAAFVRDYHMVGPPSVSLAFLGERSEGSLVGWNTGKDVRRLCARPPHGGAALRESAFPVGRVFDWDTVTGEERQDVRRLHVGGAAGIEFV